MNNASLILLWAKRLLLLTVVSLLIMTIVGQIDMGHPFKEATRCINRIYLPNGSALRCYSFDSGQLITLVLYVVAGTLIWHFADERKK